MAEPLTTTYMATRVGLYDAELLGVLIVDNVGAAAASSTMTYVNEATLYEIAGSYARGEILMELTVDGNTQPLDFSRLKVFPLSERVSLTRADDILIDPDSTPKASSTSASPRPRLAARRTPPSVSCSPEPSASQRATWCSSPAPPRGGRCSKWR